MQLLEQLAVNNIVVPDMVQECYSVIGYLQCMEEFAFSSSDEYVTEGITIKEIFNKIWGAIKAIYEKIRKMINDFINFIKSKIMKSANNKLDEMMDSIPDEKPQSVNTNKYSWQAKLDQIYKQNPFTGINPGAVTISMLELDGFVSHAFKMAYRQSLIPLENIEFTIDVLGGKGQVSDELIKDDINKLSSKIPSDTKTLINSMVNLDKWGKNSKIKELNSPQDFEKIPSIIYNAYSKDGYAGFGPYRNSVLNPSSFKFLQDKCKEAVESVNKHSKSIISSLEDARNKNDFSIKKCKDLEKLVNETSAVNDASYVAKILNQSAASLNIVSQCITYTSSGFSKTVLAMDSDLDNVIKYVKNISIKTADATFK